METHLHDVSHSYTIDHTWHPTLLSVCRLGQHEKDRMKRMVKKWMAKVEGVLCEMERMLSL